MEGMRNVYRTVVRKSEGKMPFASTGHRLEYYIKIDLLSNQNDSE
jgi:hypothetical protein